MVPEPVTVPIAAPEVAVPARAKSAAFTPVTDSEKVTVKLTVDALVGLASVRLMELTEGFVLSMV